MLDARNRIAPVPIRRFGYVDEDLMPSIVTDLLRRIRFRSDDPLRNLHVPARHRKDEDSGIGANALEGGDDTDDLDHYRQHPGEVAPIEDLT